MPPSSEQQIGELQAEAEAERHLPCGDGEPADDHPGPLPPPAAQHQEQRQRDPAAGEHVQVAALLQPPRGAGERRARDGGGPPRRAQLARQQVRAEERQREREQEQQVVADDGGVRPGADQPRRGVADQRVGEREAVAQRPELVALEEVERLGRERMAVPGDLPALRQRVPEVQRDVRSQVRRERPEEDDGQQGGRRAPPARPRARESAERIATRPPCRRELIPAPPARRNWRIGALCQLPF